MRVSFWDGKSVNVAWGKEKKNSHQTSQIKAVIVTSTTTGANERQISYRNKHIGDSDGARRQWECGHRQWVTQSPLGRTSAGRNLGMVQGACCSLVLKTKLGPVIHKSLVYQLLQTLQCTFHESRGTSRSPDRKHSSHGGVQDHQQHWSRRGRKGGFTFEWWLKKIKHPKVT